jgi:hypothetical protein
MERSGANMAINIQAAHMSRPSLNMKFFCFKSCFIVFIGAPPH